MNKVEMIKTVCGNLADDGVKVTQKDMAVYVDALVDVIKDAMMNSEDVKISGLGTFCVVDRAERTARNPQDGSTLVVPAHKSPKFKFSSAVKELVR